MGDTDMVRAVDVARAQGTAAGDQIVLGYEARFLRRKRLKSDLGREVLVDLAETVSLEDGDALVLENGERLTVRAAPEPLLEVRGPDLARLAWHIGNRHTPCQILADRLLIREDPVLAKMLEGLGAELSLSTQPFRPEGGAYGHGRTLGHSHGDAEGGHYHHHHHHHT